MCWDKKLEYSGYVAYGFLCDFHTTLAKVIELFCYLLLAAPTETTISAALAI